MEKHEEMNGILNDLLQINNDRIAGYEKAINESKDLDIDLKATFEKMIEQSGEMKTELAGIIESNEGVVEDDTTSSGKIYRAWMDIKATVTDSDRLSILGSCEFGEDAAQRAYDAALAAHELSLPEVRQVVESQKLSLKKSHELIKSQRDAHAALQK